MVNARASYEASDSPLRYYDIQDCIFQMVLWLREGAALSVASMALINYAMLHLLDQSHKWRILSGFKVDLCEIQARDRSVLRVALPSDCLGFQIGEAAQIISGGVLVATPHQVRSHQRSPGDKAICRETFALFIEPQWDAPIGPPKGVGYDAVLEEEEQELIPPLSKRLKRTPPDVSPVVFGEYLGSSFEEYYKHNN
ncbi:hypothetical protein AK812_SmicGene4122 [Symbiodinium microadriaticum]|uniref:Isopenicillin N synthase-like Fe(2+) 2OG dioxygenase domain-containing protein n=1 Tax=Symbiodinium microadriaticum TaxID=2951 RepID=A0A1Q9EX88_SYMMI|nr:hypothetical protein AK812_SmicGene4122 [Symbiodinium microadriaticum]